MSIIHPSNCAGHTLIESWIQDLRERDRAQSTIDSYADTASRAHASLPHGLPFASADELRAWIWKPGRKPATRKAYRSAVGSFFNWACHPANPRLDFNPMPLIPSVTVKRGKPRPITVDVLTNILKAAPQPHRFWFLLAAGAGMRAVEISRCDREHITAESIWVLGKGGVEALVPTHPAIWAAAQELPPGPVARRRSDGQRADRRNVYQRGNDVLTRLGYKDVTMHRLRHYYGSQVRRAAAGDLRIAQEGLRHADPKETATYTDWLNVDLVAAVHAVPLTA